MKARVVQNTDGMKKALCGDKTSPRFVIGRVESCLGERSEVGWSARVEQG